MRRVHLVLSLCAPIAAAADGRATGLLPVWLEGRWCRASEAGAVEERWLPGSANLMLGVNRTLVGDRTEAFEFLRIERGEDGTLTYVAQPGGRAPTAFRATRIEHGFLRFENPGHDFPRVITYRLDDDSLTATIAGPAEDGDSREFPFRFARCEP